jgi:hypothetical protein
LPTPVSALLHAATLVTAGIYLLIRISPILEFSGSVLLIITLIGSSTAFFAATCGLLQNDLKRIIAFSTISQLGYILLLILLLFLIYNILYLEDIHISMFSKITQNSFICCLSLCCCICCTPCGLPPLTPAALLVPLLVPVLAYQKAKVDPLASPFACALHSQQQAKVLCWRLTRPILRGQGKTCKATLCLWLPLLSFDLATQLMPAAHLPAKDLCLLLATFAFL